MQVWVAVVGGVDIEVVVLMVVGVVYVLFAVVGLLSCLCR